MGKATPSAVMLVFSVVVFCSSASGYEDQVVPIVTRQQMALLTRLHQVWLERRSATSPPVSHLQRSNLEPLVGINRATVAATLGRPDFCLPDPDACDTSPHWTYFFYPYQPASVRSIGHGVTEVTVTAGGGWALEMNFSRDGALEKASWVKQE